MDYLYKILIIDDSFSIINELANLLVGHHMEVVTASNGEEGIDALKNNEDINLCISDLNMHVMDGLSMLENIRKELPDLEIPFIMLTTEFDVELKRKGKSLGVKGWVVKPFNRMRVVEDIYKLLA